MSKSILVIDTPECCCQCRFSGADGDYCCLKENMVSDSNAISEEEYLNKRPDWCPIQELPRRKMLLGLDGASNAMEIRERGRQEGFNACIDEILKGGEAE